MYYACTILQDSVVYYAIVHYSIGMLWYEVLRILVGHADLVPDQWDGNPEVGPRRVSCQESSI